MGNSLLIYGEKPCDKNDQNCILIVNKEKPTVSKQNSKWNTFCHHLEDSCIVSLALGCNRHFWDRQFLVCTPVGLCAYKSWSVLMFKCTMDQTWRFRVWNFIHEKTRKKWIFSGMRISSWKNWEKNPFLSIFSHFFSVFLGMNLHTQKRHVWSTVQMPVSKLWVHNFLCKETCDGPAMMLFTHTFSCKKNCTDFR